VIEDLGDELGDCAFYLCGSPAMIGEAKKALAARGADPAFFYSDSFLFQSEMVAG
jgi:CDP-4-dehydro-6-deoxyglucose reductase